MLQITPNIFIIFLFICSFFIFFYVSMLFFNFKNIIIDLPLDTLKRKTYRIFIAFLLILMFISILIWRIMRRNRYIFIDKEYLYTVFLNFLNKYEITYFYLLLIILFIVLLILLWISLFSTIMIYIKGIGYTVHVYFYQYTLYSKIFTKMLLFDVKIYQFFLTTFILNVKLLTILPSIP